MATTQGGTNGQGVVFELTPAGKETVLHTFCSQPNCTDGAGPYGGLVMGKKGSLYGTTNAGGANNGGTVFEVTPKAGETVVYSFGSQSGDGGNPNAALIMDKNGNLYGPP